MQESIKNGVRNQSKSMQEWYQWTMQETTQEKQQGTSYDSLQEKMLTKREERMQKSTKNLRTVAISKRKYDKRVEQN